MKFKSESLAWLVVSGAKAQLRGSGRINGVGKYSFILTAFDGNQNGPSGVDKLRIKIWDTATRAIVYDNQPGASDDATPTMAIGGGSIVVHS